MALNREGEIMEERTMQTVSTSETLPASSRPVYQAYQILHFGFTILPIIAGLDKFFQFLVNWDAYLSPLVTRMLPVGGHPFMMAVGAIEVAAGILVAVKPKLGGYVMAFWLWGIIVNLL